MFKNQLANFERYFKERDNSLGVDTSLTVYEVFIEKSFDKEGNVLKNKDGSDRYHAIDDSQIVKLEEDVTVKKIRDDYFKKVYQVNGDYVEKVERDGKRIYYVVDEDKITKLEAGAQVVEGKNDFYKIPLETGYVLVDDTEIEKPRIIAVRKFKTEDHKQEAEDIVHSSRYTHSK